MEIVKADSPESFQEALGHLIFSYMALGACIEWSHDDEGRPSATIYAQGTPRVRVELS